MVKEGIIGYFENFILQRLQVYGAGDLSAVPGIDKDKITKEEVLVNVIP